MFLAAGRQNHLIVNSKLFPRKVSVVRGKGKQGPYESVRIDVYAMSSPGQEWSFRKEGSYLGAAPVVGQCLCWPSAEWGTWQVQTDLCWAFPFAWYQPMPCQEKKQQTAQQTIAIQEMRSIWEAFSWFHSLFNLKSASVALKAMPVLPINKKKRTILLSTFDWKTSSCMIKREKGRKMHTICVLRGSGKAPSAWKYPSLPGRSQSHPGPNLSSEIFHHSESCQSMAPPSLQTAELRTESLNWFCRWKHHVRSYSLDKASHY